jgi:hypothetical protein
MRGLTRFVVAVALIMAAAFVFGIIAGIVS